MSARLIASLGLLACLILALPRPALASCPVYLTGPGGTADNDATMVVLMRDGPRTVLTVQADYRGPAQDFALLFPVPATVDEHSVRVLPDELIDRLDRLTAPRMVEMWERDPCLEPKLTLDGGHDAPPSPALDTPSSGRAPDTDESEPATSTRVDVDEYEVELGSPKDTKALEAWLGERGLALPGGAASALAAHVERGDSFILARVDADELQFVDGRARLSPLRVHYDSERFELPIRLAALNAPPGGQDLVIHVLAREQRYEVANRDNLAIATNLEVTARTRERFEELYALLFAELLLAHPGAVVTEYAAPLASCEPCSEPPLSAAELAELGADQLPTFAPLFFDGHQSPDSAAHELRRDLVVTRLHLRSRSSDASDALLLRPVDPIIGGAAGHEGTQARAWQANDFRARYLLRHPWKGPIACEEARRGLWDPPLGVTIARLTRPLARAPGRARLERMLRAPLEPVARLSSRPLDPLPQEPSRYAPVEREPPATGEAPQRAEAEAKAGAPEPSAGCARCALASPEPSSLVLLAALALLRRRRRGARAARRDRGFGLRLIRGRSR